MLPRLWDDLRRGGAVGGIAFADEWWKNYDTPRAAGAWWGRVPAADDEARHNEARHNEARHDVDPEESYGPVTAERRPKPAGAPRRLGAAGAGRQGAPAGAPRSTTRSPGGVVLWGVVLGAALGTQ